MKKMAYVLGLLTLLLSMISFAIPTHPAGALEAGWSGEWSTSWTIMEYGSFNTYRFDMTLVQSGSMVNGTSNYYGWNLNGTVSGNTLTGTWSAPSKPPIMNQASPHISGQFQFTMDSSGTTFRGIFKGEYHYTWDERFVVTGARKGTGPTPPYIPPTPTPPYVPPTPTPPYVPPTPTPPYIPPTPTSTPTPSVGCQFTGKWDTEWGEMTLTQVGNTLTGNYDYQGGKIEGTVDGTTATGTWSEAPFYKPPLYAGDFIFTLSADCKSLS